MNHRKSILVTRLISEFIGFDSICKVFLSKAEQPGARFFAMSMSVSPASTRIPGPSSLRLDQNSACGAAVSGLQEACVCAVVIMGHHRGCLSFFSCFMEWVADAKDQLL